VELLKLRRLATLRTAVVASMGVHGALIVAATLMPLGGPRVQAAQAVTMEVVDFVAPPEEPPPSAPPPPAAAKPRAAPPALVATAPKAAAEPEAAPAPSAPPDEAPAEPTAPIVAAGNGAPSGGPTSAAPAVTGGVPGGVAGGAPGGTGTAPRPIDEAQRKASMRRYHELLLGRLRAASRYPDAARELELVGEVAVEITVDRAGALKRVHLHGACPHAVLCEDALRTMRSLAPLPPLPPELADNAVQLIMPLRYDLP
jgi:protein TonB